MRILKAVLGLVGTLGWLSSPGCGGGGCGCLPPPPAFANPQRVSILGFSDQAMEPALSPDGRFLFFNTSNDPSVNTDLHWAERQDDLTYLYRGPVTGANSPSLDAVPSMDQSGRLYFISTRSYPQTQSTVYRGNFQAGTLGNLEMVQGLSASGPGRVIFDAFIDSDGDSLYFAEGDYSSGHLSTALIALATRSGSGFTRSTDSADILRLVNLPGGTQYAPSLSASGLELFFTRLDGPSSPAIYRSTRSHVGAAFGTPEKISAIAGFAEAPAPSPDGKGLYYHLLENGRFVVFRVSRP